MKLLQTHSVISNDESNNERSPITKPLNSLKKWLSVKAFQPWLQLCDTPDRVYCKFCGITLGAARARLKNHTISKNHMLLAGLKKEPPKEDFEDSMCDDDKELITAEIKFAAGCMKLNLPFSSAPTLLEVMRDIKDDELLGSIKMGATKTNAFVKNVIGKSAKLKLADILKKQPFSICLDESTDIAKDKSLVILVKFFNFIDGSVKTEIWEMVPVYNEKEEVKCGSKKIFNCIKKSFEKCDIPLTNIFACCFDGCSVNTGKITGLVARLKSAIPGILCVTCPAHATHLCAKHAIDELPNNIKEFITKVNNMLNSAKRCKEFSNLQKEFAATQNSCVD